MGATLKVVHPSVVPSSWPLCDPDTRLISPEPPCRAGPSAPVAAWCTGSPAMAAGSRSRTRRAGWPAAASAAALAARASGAAQATCRQPGRAAQARAVGVSAALPLCTESNAQPTCCSQRHGSLLWSSLHPPACLHVQLQLGSWLSEGALQVAAPLLGGPPEACLLVILRGWQGDHIAAAFAARWRSWRWRG
jgi:hypothetical protein